MKYNKELLNRFLTEKVAIALRTQDEWNQFMELLEKETDLTWYDGDEPSKRIRFWSYYKFETQVALQELCLGGVFSKIISCAKTYYKNNGYEIIEFKELIKEKEMNLADKLRFLADRCEDVKEFYIGSVRYSLNKGELLLSPSGYVSDVKINKLVNLDLKLAPQWTFTEDEKVILRNLPEKFTWLARCEDDDLIFFTEKPLKKNKYWGLPKIKCDFLYSPFMSHLFKSIQWSDEEPCEFRKYL